MTATDAQVRIMMSERKKGRSQTQAAVKANVRSRKTVSKYERLKQYPSELKKPRQYRTREDPFAEDWSEVVRILEQAPEIEAKALFEWLCEQQSERYEEGQLRTFQRRVSEWRGLNVEQVAVLEQIHRPGEVMQTDGTWLNELRITVQGGKLEGVLIHSVLVYSNWEWGILARSESLAAIERGVGESLSKLGYVPQYHQTDNSSAATYQIPGEEKRDYSRRYLSLLDHYGLEPRLTHIRRPQENGDVESANGALKRALEQHLLLRGSRDFAGIAEVEAFIQEVMVKRNQRRQRRLAQEMAVMKPLTVSQLVTRERVYAKVSQGSWIRVKHNTYSVPTSLIGRTVTVYLSEWHLDIYYGRALIDQVPRLSGRDKYHINYRHIIETLLKKPGGFRDYRYREALFPRLIFRQAWEQLGQWYAPRKADLIYLRILHLAARTMECDVACALELLVQQQQKWAEHEVESLLNVPSITIPTMAIPIISLAAYDRLLAEVADVNG